MRIMYDAEVDVLYIRFLETTVTTQHVAEGVAIDYAAEGGNFDLHLLAGEARFYRRESVPLRLWRGMRFCQSK
jgi:hypothetical protein